jgi:hypothetical protein
MSFTQAHRPGWCTSGRRVEDALRVESFSTTCLRSSPTALRSSPTAQHYMPAQQSHSVPPARTGPGKKATWRCSGASRPTRHLAGLATQQDGSEPVSTLQHYMPAQQSHSTTCLRSSPTAYHPPIHTPLTDGLHCRQSRCNATDVNLSARQLLRQHPHLEQHQHHPAKASQSTIGI